MFSIPTPTPSYLPLKEGLQSWDFEGFSGKLLSVSHLNNLGETNVKMNEKPCQSLTDTGATLSTLSLLAAQPVDEMLGN